ncbi:MAG: diguanylate cyclase, partial [Anaerolineales bacterium]
MKTDTSSRQMLRTPAGVTSIVSALGIIAYILWIFSGRYNPQTDALLSGIGLVLLNMLAGVLGVYIISQRAYGMTLRWAWFLLTLGAWCFVIAEGLWTYYSIVLGIDPFPSPADYFYVLYYPLTLVGVLLLSFAFVPRQERSLLWLDIGILLMFFGMLLWYYFLASPELLSSSLSEYVALVYPAGDFLIFVVALALILRDLTRVARWILALIALAMVFSAVGDIAFAVYELQDIPYVIAYLNVMWMSAVLAQIWATARLITSGPGVLKDSPVRSRPWRQMLRLTLPYLAIAGGLGLLFMIIRSNLSPDRRFMGMLTGAYILIALVLWRQYIVSKENIRLYESVQRIAWTDSLTGVYNRHFFNEILPREMERASRYGHHLSVLLLDIDGFKSFNDTYGHLKGDAVLKIIARLFTTQLRASDTIARFGGDEFVVILPETNRRRALAIAERIRSAVSARTFGSTHLSVSIGVSAYRSGLTPEQLLDEADQDMYRRKNSAKGLPLPEESTSIDVLISSLRD